MRSKKSVLTPLARNLRFATTEAEKKLWHQLRDRRLNGFKFRRQIPVGRYVVDFVCPEAMLIVELDGGQHAERTQQDAARTAFLNQQGYRVLRFWNNDALGETEAVLTVIREQLGLSSDASRGPSP